MKAIALAALLLMTGCGTSTHSAAATTPISSPPRSSLPADLPSPTAEQPTTASASRTTNPVLATLAVSLTPLGKSLSCRLPVIYDDQYGVTVQAGFIAFPNPVLSRDTSATQQALFYDRAYSKWLPVWRTDVSPDGKQYAYGRENSGNHELHVVDVATGTDHIVYSYTGQQVYRVVDFSADGIYLTNAPGEGWGQGLWLFKFDGTPPHLINRTITAPAIGGGAAWGLDFNPADPSPAPGGMVGPMNRLLRVDLASGTPTSWLYRPGSSIGIMGFDVVGHPLIIVVYPNADGASSFEVWLVTSATVSNRIFQSSGPAIPGDVSAIDSHGVWITGSNVDKGSVWLYANGSIQLVATVDALNFWVAGGCIP